MSAYLDHAATTPMRPEALEAMLPALGDLFGNPSGGHRVARRAQRLVDDAREDLADALGAHPGELIFTSGGTEADNLAVHGQREGRRVLCSAVEHHAVLDPVLLAGGEIVPVTEAGLVDLDALAAALDPSVALVSVMLANNEIGTVQPLAAVAELVRRHAPNARLHTDAVNAFSWADVASAASGADLISVSAHKFGGPKGVGALVARRGVQLSPLLVGGGQERERRAGTPNVAGIVAMAAAARVTVESRDQMVATIAARRDRLVDGLLTALPGTVETAVVAGSRAHKVAASGHLCFPGVESEALLFLLDRENISASAASSCASGAIQTSHVLLALGVPPDLAKGAVRLSLGWSTTDAEIDHALAVIPDSVRRLQSHAAQRPMVGARS